MKKITVYFFSRVVSFFLLVACLFSFSLFLDHSFIPQAQAQEEKKFSTTLHTTYTINVNGTTHVEHAFQIQNLTPSYFITKYGIQLSSRNIDDITINENGVSLPAETVTTKTQTSIGITFPDKLVGEKKNRKFSINYNNSDIAQISGKVLEVTIPQLADSSEYDQYQVTLITPAQFGKPTRLTPDKYTFKETASHITINFSQPSGSGISAIFGNSQVFDLQLLYYLENPNNQNVITQIALPPDSPYQRLNYQTLDPVPENIKIDPDGNWIATYQLPANSTTKVSAHVLAHLTLDQNGVVPSYSALPKHTQAQDFWETQNPELQSLASTHTTPKEIYDYTTQTLTYTSVNIADDLERLGAEKSLQNPTLATCQEFTDLFVTLARANQIPSRRVTGYAYTRDNSLRPLSLVDDILHAWPEYYSEEKKTWVAIDPTWGNTTQGVDYFHQFDLNHIIFAINGVSSTLPYPAGAYKIAELPTKNVEVNFAEKYEEEEPSFEIRLTPKRLFFFDIPGMYDLEIINQTGSARYQLDLSFQSLQSELSLQTSSPRIEYLLPYQTEKMPLIVYNVGGLLPKSDVITIDILHQDKNLGSFTHNVTSISKFSQQLTNPYFYVGMGIASIVIALTTGSILISRRKKSSSLRRESQESQESS